VLFGSIVESPRFFHDSSQSNWQSFIACESDVAVMLIAQASAIADITRFIFLIGSSQFLLSPPAALQ
jgi:hypothetical protein